MVKIEIDLKLSGQSQNMINHMPNFDIDKFLEWYAAHKNVIGGSVVLEYLERCM